MTMGALNLRLLLHLKLLDGTLYPAFKSCSVTGVTRVLNNQVLTYSNKYNLYRASKSRMNRLC